MAHPQPPRSCVPLAKSTEHPDLVRARVISPVRDTPAASSEIRATLDRLMAKGERDVAACYVELILRPDWRRYTATGLERDEIEACMGGAILRVLDAGRWRDMEPGRTVPYLWASIIGSAKRRNTGEIWNTCTRYVRRMVRGSRSYRDDRAARKVSDSGGLASLVATEPHPCPESALLCATMREQLGGLSEVERRVFEALEASLEAGTTVKREAGKRRPRAFTLRDAIAAVIPGTENARERSALAQRIRRKAKTALYRGAVDLSPVPPSTLRAFGLEGAATFRGVM